MIESPVETTTQPNPPIAQGGQSVRIAEVRYSYGAEDVLRGVSLDVQAGEFLTLLGPSGSGKTTLLRLLAGMTFPDSGRLHFGDKEVSRLPSNRRNVGFVFQNYALFPHMNVFKNVAFGLKVRHLERSAIRARTLEALEMVDMLEFADRRPNELSGGQQQRVSLARAVAIRPDVLLMDEPLGSLDKRLRQRLQDELRQLQRRLGITTIYVTHDQDEAFALSHRVAIMRSGRIEQVASPQGVYREPATSFVAGFVGDVNIIANTDPAVSRFGIRPECVSIASSPDTQECLQGRVESLIFQGRTFRAQIRTRAGDLVLVDIDGRHPEIGKFDAGHDVYMRWSPGDSIVLVESLQG